jgi:hypothetical protein
MHYRSGNSLCGILSHKNMEKLGSVQTGNSLRKLSKMLEWSLPEWIIIIADQNQGGHMIAIKAWLRSKRWRRTTLSSEFHLALLIYDQGRIATT